ncbi:MAG: UbiH/UbiF/VisC/COQ6 family ubiquinone biosynthesis hydroxylase [Gammaproteobacteria bacterium]
MSHYDIIIIGSGIVGATAALALAKTTSLKIALIDAQQISNEWQPDRHDHRVSAISQASRQIFQNLNVWKKILAKRISAYQDMRVWEGSGNSKIDFNCADVNVSQLGFIIEDSVIRISLYESLREQNNMDLLFPIQLLSLQNQPKQVELRTADNQIFTTKLLIAADGANSWVRDQVNIQLKTWDYEHTAIVATVKTAQAHQATAWQRFLSTGPLAFLPLHDAHTSSIVWSTTPAHAQELLQLDDTNFKTALAAGFAHKLGEITQVSKRYHFPLQMRHAKNYVQNRIALIGDAAHTIHPLAGQGVNMGLLDAACLAEVIVEANAKQRDFSSLSTLRRYERWRKGDNLAMLAGVEVLKKLFMSDKQPIITLRDFGVNLTNKTAFLKDFFINHALGKRGDLPKLAQS